MGEGFKYPLALHDSRKPTHRTKPTKMCKMYKEENTLMCTYIQGYVQGRGGPQMGSGPPKSMSVPSRRPWENSSAPGKTMEPAKPVKREHQQELEAPVVLTNQKQSSNSMHVWDFYKIVYTNQKSLQVSTVVKKTRFFQLFKKRKF